VKYAVLRDDKIITKGETHNMVVFSSRAFLAKVAAGYDDIASPNKFGPIKAMAIGVGNTAPKITDTALENEIYRQNIAAANTALASETGNIVTATATSVTLTIRTKLTPYAGGGTGFPTTALTGTKLVTEFGLIGGFDSTQSDTPPGDPSSGTAGIKGTLFNRALIGPVSLSASDTLLIENIITWG
jgi:hypothetical protein